MSERIRSIKCNVQCMNFLDGVFYALYFIAFNYLFLTTTMFYDYAFFGYRGMLERGMNIVTFFLIGLSVISIVVLFDSLKERILPFLLFAAAMAYTIYRGGTYNNDILVFFLLVISSKKKSFKLIGYISLLCGSLWIIASLIASLTGFIPDVISYNGGHGFGIICNTDLMCHLFMLTMLIFIIRKGRPGLPSLALSAVILLWAGLAIQADIGFFCYAVLLVVTIAYKLTFPMGSRLRNKFIMKPIAVIMIFSFVILAVTTLLLTYYCPESTLRSLSESHDIFKLIAIRISCGKTAFENYKILPLGQKIYEFGTLNDIKKSIFAKDYFFLDVSYTKILFHNGYIMLGAVLTLFTALQIRLLKNKQFYAMFIMTMFAIICAIEHSMIEPAYCVFAYLMFAEIDFDRPLVSAYIEE